MDRLRTPRTLLAMLALLALVASLLAVHPSITGAARAQEAPGPVDDQPVEPLVDDGFTTLRISKGGDRLAGDPDPNISPLEGAVFYAIPGEGNQSELNNPPSIDSTSQYTCTTDAQGTCDIVVPDRTAGDSGYWIVEHTAPPGWNRLETIGTANGINTTKTARPYTYFTRNVEGADQVHRVPRDSFAYKVTRPGTNAIRSQSLGDFWINARENPPIVAKCGLNIALVFDRSGSTGAFDDEYKAAGKLFVSASGGLGGTPSTVSIYEFQGRSAAKVLPRTALTTAQGISDAHNAIDGLSQPGGGTPWDQGLREVAFNGAETYDIVLFLTDGDPTTYIPDNRGNGGNQSDTEFAHVEYAAAAANAIKAQVGPNGGNTRMLALGIELKAGGSADNLKAISGPTENVDYFLTGFGRLVELLRGLAEETCGGSLTVIKQTIDARGQSISVAAPGYSFTATTEGDYLVNDNPPPDLVDSITQTTNADGAVNFAIDFTVAPQPIAVTVSENPQPGLELNDVQCGLNGAPIEVIDGPDGLSFTVNVSADDIVACTAENRIAYDLILRKEWVDAITGDTAQLTIDGEPAEPPTVSTASGVAGSEIDDTNIVTKEVSPGDVVNLAEVLGAGNAAQYGTTLVCDQPGLTYTEGALTGQYTVPAEPAADPITCTFTNTPVQDTFELRKAVQDPSGLVPPNTTYTVEVRCELPEGSPITGFDPLTVMLTADQAETIGPLPVGAICEITETDAQGADPAPDPITIEVGEDEDAEVVVTNPYAADSFEVSKVVAGPGAPFVPPGTEYTVEVSCTFPDGFPASGAIPGYNPLVLTLTAGQTESVGPLPLGSVCGITETNNQGADEVSGVPSSVIVGEGEAVAVVVTNTYAADSFEVTKTVDDNTGVVPPGTEYTIEVTCTYRDGFPATGPVPGFDPLTLTLTGGETETVGPLPVGSVCGIAETDNRGAEPVTVVPNSLSVGDTENAQVIVTNTYNVDSFPVSKVVDGPGAPFVPDGTEYTIEVSCTYPDDFPVSGPVPGYNPLTVPLTDGQTATVGPLPVGTVCGITETNNQGADPVTVDPTSVIVGEGEAAAVVVTNTYGVDDFDVTKLVDDATGVVPPGTAYTIDITCTFQGAPVAGFNPLTVPLTAGQTETVGPLPVGAVCGIAETDDQGADPVTVVPNSVNVGADDAVDVVVTNTYRVADFTLSKVVNGPGAPFVPPGTEFTVDVACTYPDDFPVTGAVPGFDPLTVTLTNGQNETIGPLPVGTVCGITETNNQGADPVTVEPRSITVGEAENAQVVVTNTYGVDDFPVSKVVNGPGAPFVPPGTEFTVAVACTFLGAPVAGFDPLTVTLVSGGTETVGPLPVGAECAITETDDQGADPVTVEPGSVTVGEDEAVEVVVTNTYNVDSFPVSKVVDGPGAPFVPDGTEYTIEVSCTYPDDFPVSGPVPGFDPVTFTLTDGGSETVGPLPVGTVCGITETNDQGADQATVVPNSVNVGEDDAVAVVVTNTYGVDSFEVSKVVDGPGAPFVPPGTGYTVEVSCTFLGAPVVGFDPLELTLTDGETAPVGPLPVGAECVIAETDDQGADPVTVMPSSLTVGEGEAVAVVVTNTYGVGEFDVSKVVDGPGAPFVPPGTEFTVEVSCTFLSTPIAGFDPLTVPLTDGQIVTVGPLPIGAECAIAETEGQGADPVTVVPGNVTVGEQEAVEVVVTNTFGVGSATILKVVDGELADVAPDEFTVEVVCVTAFGETLPTIEVTISPDAPVVIDDLPLGAECTVTETDDGGASEVVIDPNRFPVESEETPVEVTVTNTFDPAGLQILKETAGPGAPFLPEGTVFTASVQCTFNGATVFDGTVEFTIADPGLITGLPVGAECTVAETETNGAELVIIEPEQPVVLEGEDPVLVQVSITNVYGTGGFAIEKVLTGGGAAAATGPFEFEVRCTYLGQPLDPQPANVVITPPDLTAVVEGVPVGAECAIEELEPYGGADGPAEISPASVVIGTEEAATFTATNTFTPVPPTTPETGASGVRASAMASTILLTLGVMLLLVARNRRVRQ